jgi:AmmeMemoRadiSam system protein A
MLIAIGATEDLKHDCEVLNYEAPFGVGYLVAQITATGQKGATQGVVKIDESVLPKLAREAVEKWVEDETKLRPLLDDPLLSSRAACFVSLKTWSGELRGCIGTIEPTENTLAEEIVTNAIAAATRDPRFPPVRPDELSQLRYSVDVLSASEPANFDELDPNTFGVIVEDEERTRRGLLLPDIPGVNSATEQVEIAARKAGIPPGDPLRFYRFRVNRYRESNLGDD